MQPARIWFVIKEIINKYDMSSSLPYRRLNNDPGEQVELRASKEIKVYNSDGTHQTVTVTPRSSSEQICSELTETVLFSPYEWSIVEVWKDEGIERILESHECVLPCYYRTENERNRNLVLRITDKMFDMYIRPQMYYSSLYKTFDQKIQTKIIKKVLDGDVDPLYFGQVWIYDCNKTETSWEAKILLLKNKKLYLSSNHTTILTFLKKTENGCFRNCKLTNSQNKCQLKVWSYLTDFRIFICIDKKLTNSPTDYCLCLVAASGLKQYIACDNKTTLSYWMCAMRLSKYGKQLRDNYRSFVKKHNNSNEFEYSKKDVSNESVRTHVAMDFNGKVGRIVEDPKEALAIAQADSSNTRRSCRSNGRTTPGLQAAVTKLENDIHLSQPWYHKNMSRDQAASVLNGLGNKDGVFLIRESKRNTGTFVLTFKCGGKIIHTPIAMQLDPINNDLVCFTIDNGVTKFYDLLQLVEFYQLNAGSLPTRLMHYVVQIPVNK